MRRADRLFQIVQFLRTRRLVTAGEIARELEVSPRTIYRDVADLIGSGVPIDGEAGVGYALGSGYELPPLMLEAGEIEALVLGARMVEAMGDDELARRARSVLRKVESVVPERLRPAFERREWHVSAPIRRETRAHVEALRHAIDSRRKLRLRYVDEKGAATERVVRPLCLAFWAPHWYVGTWCELRQAFRSFRPDRMVAVEPLRETFVDEPGRDLAAFLAEREAELAAAGIALDHDR